MGSSNDMSGFDVFTTPVSRESSPEREISSEAVPIEYKGERKFNMSEVSTRWGTSAYYVKKQISAGMPMCKQANNRWEINEADLLSWEAYLEENHLKEKSRNRLSIIIIVLLVVAILIVGGTFLLYLTTANSESSSEDFNLPGVLFMPEEESANTDTPQLNDPLPTSNPYAHLTVDYVFEQSNTQLLTTEEIELLSEEQCMIARNEIAARHGRGFVDPALQEYFDSRHWYSNTMSASAYDASVSNILNSYEVRNSDLIRSVEAAKGFNQ